MPRLKKITPTTPATSNASISLLIKFTELAQEYETAKVKLDDDYGLKLSALIKELTS